MKLAKWSKLPMLQMEINGENAPRIAQRLPKTFPIWAKCCFPLLCSPLDWVCFACVFCVCGRACVGLRLGIAIDSERKLLHSSSDFVRPTQLGLYFVHLQMPWVFHFPLFPQIKFSKLFAAKLSTHHSQSANCQRTERDGETQKVAETNDNVDIETIGYTECLLNLQIPC